MINDFPIFLKELNWKAIKTKSLPLRHAKDHLLKLFQRYWTHEIIVHFLSDKGRNTRQNNIFFIISRRRVLREDGRKVPSSLLWRNFPWRNFPVDELSHGEILAGRVLPWRTFPWIKFQVENLSHG